ncbi:hypothetical protein PFICI_11013 [Pestalotiopsis fici W106-1]|uniref:Zn(2)-C6 fungal-type domain-containing protein n=1 Tax=Pestalotiopsis fici (strain W106-1 / CGMCC3.15140) TaxID=1229662 RepID=W3WTK2_PESFW|nr:uncharacterized protein PFICI_11013 [Pestalotiopsis fici W106-1]ETS77139.1 hypothetical protein PFICI_11013 [Pestalotiopsis fici W106-1]
MSSDPSTTPSSDQRLSSSTPPFTSALGPGGEAVGVGVGTTTTAAAPAKRTRVLLSCGACRASKLKCDRQDPCSQCLKKGRADTCRYAPRPQKPQKPAKTMAARLRRLEGMVRGMLDENGVPSAGRAAEAAAALGLGGAQVTAVPADQDGAGEDAGSRQESPAGVGSCALSSAAAATRNSGVDAGGQVVSGDLGATSYIGGTHFAAILQDIDELKSYFDYPEDEEVDGTTSDPYEAERSPEMLLLSQSGPTSREELLSLLPEKNVADRLLMRYFSSNSPSQHILHKPTFNQEYNEFWRDPSTASLHWVAILFMVLSHGVFFCMFQTPHELEVDSPLPAMDRFALYRALAGAALTLGKYSHPNQWTVQAMLLYVESEFMTAPQSQINCYLLCATLIRIMLKMGLHRDPDKLPNISPYDGEMRRRCWNLATQIDLLVAFHLGLPAMIHGIESDTDLPRNLIDSDFDPSTKVMPPQRHMGDYTPLCYPINKAALCRVFGHVARQAHSLKVPTYAEIMALDAVLESTYARVPSFMKVKSLAESVTDPPMQVIQRYGLASLYQKSRCVLHRRHLTDAVPTAEHSYSRRACLEGALELLRCQETLYEACQPGGLLSPNGWFIASLAMNDFLLADMIIALIIQSEHYEADEGSDSQNDNTWLPKGTPKPTREELFTLLRRSLFIWQQTAGKSVECKKAADLIGAVTRKIEGRMGKAPLSSAVSPDGLPVHEEQPDLMAGLTIDANASDGFTGPNMVAGGNDVFDPASFFNPSVPGVSYGDSTTNANISWMFGPDGYDWTQIDAFASPNDNNNNNLDMPDVSQPQNTQDRSWLDRNPLDDLDFLTRTSVTGTTSLGLR